MSNFKAAIRRMARAAYPVGSIRTVLRGPLAGIKFVVQDGMGPGFAFGRDSHNFSFFRDKVREGDRVFDVGGNCGQMALLFSRLVGTKGQVISFEPVPRNANLSRQNLAMNRCGNVRVFEMAVGRSQGRSLFNYDNDHHAEGSLVGFSAGGYELGNTIEVPTDTLLHVVEQTGIVPTIVKIDVEGGGAEVIAGATGLFEQHGPNVYLEMHSTTTDCPEFKGLLELRDRFGYRIHALDGSPVDQPIPGWGTPLWLTKKRRQA